MAGPGGRPVSALAVGVLVVAIAALCAALAVAPGGHHCSIGWPPPRPGETLPRTVHTHWLWREHTACDTDACTWKRMAMTAMWREGRVIPAVRIEDTLRGDL